MLCAHCTFVLVYIPLHIKKPTNIFAKVLSIFLLPALLRDTDTLTHSKTDKAE